jgi:hypothetical protein
MKWGKRLGRLGFVYGFVGSLLFYASPMGSPTFESHLLCPWCPYIDMIGGRLAWLQLGLVMGLIHGVILALVCLGVGYATSRIASAKPSQ